MTATRAVLPLVDCQPWCVDGDGHPGRVFLDDQYCTTDQLDVDLSMHPQIPDHRVVRDGRIDYGTGADQLNVSGSASPLAEPHVYIGHDQQAELAHFVLRLTPAEARELIEALQLVLGQIS